MNVVGKMFDTDVLKLINELSKGIYLWEEQGRLKYKCKKEKISEEILNELRVKKAEIVEFFRKCESNSFPISPLQSAYLIGEEKNCELGNTNAHYYIEYEASNINIERLEESLNILIENHDALRMIVLKEGKNLILERVSPYKISMYTYIGIESRKAVRSVWENYTYTPQTWPMFHFEVGKAEKGNDVLHISFDCLILDAWSAKKLISELFKLYSGERLKFPEFTFKDYLEQAVNYDYKQEKQAESYWKEKISHMKIPSFKTRIPIEAVVEPKFERVSIRLR